MAPQIPRVTYFSGRGQGEAVRVCLAEAVGTFEDNRVTDISALKPELPFGQVPFLEMPDGFKMSQSMSICRYLANKYGFAGKTAEERAHADMIVDGISDVRAKLYPVLTAKENKEEKVAQCVNEVLPKWLGYFEKLLNDNKGGQGFFVGDDLTYADVLIFVLFDFFRHPSWFGPEKAAEILKPFPLLMAHMGRIAARPKIAAYIQKRPDTPW